jgi:hypothetical protein
MTKKVFVAIPAGDGKLYVETVESLMQEFLYGLTNDVLVMPQMVCGNSILPRARNQLVAMFLASECDVMVFVDSDVSWTPGDLCKLTSFEEDIVGMAYRGKCDNEVYPLRWNGRSAEIWANSKGLIAVEGLQTGFMKISRRCLEDLIAKNPDLAYNEDNAPSGTAYRLFDFNHVGRDYFGEDIWFCLLAAKFGYQSYLYPEATLGHTGGKRFMGNLGDWLRARMMKDIIAPQKGEENVEVGISEVRASEVSGVEVPQGEGRDSDKERI